MPNVSHEARGHRDLAWMAELGYWNPTGVSTS